MMASYYSTLVSWVTPSPTVPSACHGAGTRTMTRLWRSSEDPRIRLPSTSVGTARRRSPPGRCSPAPTPTNSSTSDPRPGVASRPLSRCAPPSRTSPYRPRALQGGCSALLGQSGRKTKHRRAFRGPVIAAALPRGPTPPAWPGQGNRLASFPNYLLAGLCAMVAARKRLAQRASPFAAVHEGGEPATLGTFSDRSLAAYPKPWPSASKRATKRTSALRRGARESAGRWWGVPFGTLLVLLYARSPKKSQGLTSTSDKSSEVTTSRAFGGRRAPHLVGHHHPPVAGVSFLLERYTTR